MAIRDWIREIFTGTIGSTLVDKLNLTQPTSNEDQRAALFLLFQGLPPDVATVMWRRHREATTRFSENQFVSALTKLPKEERKESVIRLAQMSDAEFWQALDLLSPKSSTTGETVKRIAISIDQAAERLGEELAEELEPTRKKLAKRANKKGWKSWLDF